MIKVEEGGAVVHRFCDRVLQGTDLEIEIALADEIGDRHQPGIDDRRRPVAAAERDRVLGGSDHLVSGQEQVRPAVDDLRRCHVFSIEADAKMAHHRAALLRKAGHVEDHRHLAVEMRGHAEDGADRQDAGAADAGNGDVPGTVADDRDLRQRDFDIRMFDRPALPAGAAMDGDEGRAEALDAGKVLVAARLIDLPLAAELGLQRLDRNAVGLHRAIAAALADRRVDEDALGRILHQRRGCGAGAFSAAQVWT